MKKLIITFVVGLSLIGCASQAKYEAWAKVETSKNAAKSSQADALAKVASSSQDKTLAAFAVFTMAQLKDTTNSPMPTDDGLEYLKILASIGGNIALKVIDKGLQMHLADNALTGQMHTTDALVKTPKTVDPVLVYVPVPAE